MTEAKLKAIQGRLLRALALKQYGLPCADVQPLIDALRESWTNNALLLDRLREAEERLPC